MRVVLIMANYGLYFKYGIIWYFFTGFCYLVIDILDLAGKEIIYSSEYFMLILSFFLWPVIFRAGLETVLKGEYFSEISIFPSNTYPIVPVVTLVLLVIVYFFYRWRSP
jgi:hypothetical protein